MKKKERTLASVKECVVDFYNKKRRMPSYSELAKAIGVASKNACIAWVQKLEEAGIVSTDASGRLSLGRNFGGVKLLGLVEAGFPSAAEEEDLDTTTIDDYLIENRSATYMLRVKGDSMIEAGIQEGDMVIVERGKEPWPGDIVIASVDGAFTMKYYRVKNGKPYLDPANSKYKPIHPTGSLNITAVVKGVVRKY